MPLSSEFRSSQHRRVSGHISTVARCTPRHGQHHATGRHVEVAHNQSSCIREWLAQTTGSGGFRRVRSLGEDAAIISACATKTQEAYNNSEHGGVTATGKRRRMTPSHRVSWIPVADRWVQGPGLRAAGAPDEAVPRQRQRRTRPAAKTQLKCLSGREARNTRLEKTTEFKSWEGTPLPMTFLNEKSVLSGSRPPRVLDTTSTGLPSKVPRGGLEKPRGEKMPPKKGTRPTPGLTTPPTSPPPCPPNTVISLNFLPPPPPPQRAASYTTEKRPWPKR